MKFTVIWVSDAEQDLAALWLASTDRAALTAACHRIDQQLAVNPEQLGVVCFDTVRTLVEFPLTVDFEIIEEDRIVHVLSVWDLTAGQP